MLTAFSLFWFERTGPRAEPPGRRPTWRRSPRRSTAIASLAGRAMLVRPRRRDPRGVRRPRVPDRLRVGAVPRGGSGVRASRCRPGFGSPTGCPSRSSRPTTKAEQGHDLPLTLDETGDLVGRGLAERLRELTVGIYERIAEVALRRGVIVADTKLEFGFAGGELAADRRGRDARLVAVLARRRVRARPRAAELRQAVRARLARCERLGPRAAAARAARRRRRRGRRPSTARRTSGSPASRSARYLRGWASPQEERT